MRCLKCPCGRESQLLEPASIQEQSIKSGFKPIFTYEARTVWLCPDCHPKVHKLAKEILEIIKEENIHFPNLLSFLKD